jgi:glutathione peroxidase-family protein
LINKEGKAVDWFASSTSPSSPKIISAIEKVLSEHD